MKRFIATMLAVMMLITMMPTSVFAENTIEPTVTPVVTVEPTVEPIAETTEGPVVESTEGPVVESTEGSVVESTEEPAVEPTEGSAVEPTEEPSVEPTEEPDVEPTVEPVVEPTEEPVSEPTDTPTDETTTDLTENPNTDHIEEVATDGTTGDDAYFLTYGLKRSWGETIYLSASNTYWSVIPLNIVFEDGYVGDKSWNVIPLNNYAYVNPASGYGNTTLSFYGNTEYDTGTRNDGHFKIIRGDGVCTEVIIVDSYSHANEPYLCMDAVISAGSTFSADSITLEDYVEFDTNCSWNASVNVDWCTLSEYSDPKANQYETAHSIDVYLASNTSGQSRCCTITISADGCDDIHYYITQLGDSVEPYITLDQSVSVIGWYGGSGYRDVLVYSNCDWNVEVVTNDWSVEAERNGNYVHLSWGDVRNFNNTTSIVKVYADNCEPQYLYVVRHGGSDHGENYIDAEPITVFVGSTSTVVPESYGKLISWNATVDSDWVTLSQYEGTTKVPLYAICEGNDTGDYREFTVTINMYWENNSETSTRTIYQAPYVRYYDTCALYEVGKDACTISEIKGVFGEFSKLISMEIITPEWLSFYPDESDQYYYTLNVEANEGEPRIGKIILKYTHQYGYEIKDFVIEVRQNGVSTGDATYPEITLTAEKVEDAGCDDACGSWHDCLILEAFVSNLGDFSLEDIATVGYLHNVNDTGWNEYLSYEVAGESWFEGTWEPEDYYYLPHEFESISIKAFIVMTDGTILYTNTHTENNNAGSEEITLIATPSGEIVEGTTVSFTVESSSRAVTLYIDAFEAGTNNRYTAVEKDMTRNGTTFTAENKFTSAGKKIVWAETADGTKSEEIEITVIKAEVKLDTPVYTGVTTATVGEPITFSWTAVDNATGYTAWVRPVNNTDDVTNLSDSISGQYVSHTFTEAGSYYLEIYAVGEEGYGASDACNVTITVDNPTHCDHSGLNYEYVLDTTEYVDTGDGVNHKIINSYSCYCKDCGAFINDGVKDEYPPLEAHVFDANGVCIRNCGAKIEVACKHEGTYTDYNVWSDEGQKIAENWFGNEEYVVYSENAEDPAKYHNAATLHFRVCNDCGRAFDAVYGEAMPEKHDYTYGDACVCGYDRNSCVHRATADSTKYIGIICQQNDAATHYVVADKYMYTCEYCEKTDCIAVIPRSEDQWELQGHTWDKDGVCQSEGCAYACEHTEYTTAWVDGKSKTVSITDNKDGATHTHVYTVKATCSNCQKDLGMMEETYSAEEHRVRDGKAYYREGDTWHQKVTPRICSCGYADVPRVSEAEPHSSNEVNISTIYSILENNDSKHICITTKQVYCECQILLSTTVDSNEEYHVDYDFDSFCDDCNYHLRPANADNLENIERFLNLLTDDSVDDEIEKVRNRYNGSRYIKQKFDVPAEIFDSNNIVTCVFLNAQSNATLPEVLADALTACGWGDELNEERNAGHSAILLIDKNGNGCFFEVGDSDIITAEDVEKASDIPPLELEILMMYYLDHSGAMGPLYMNTLYMNSADIRNMLFAENGAYEFDDHSIYRSCEWMNSCYYDEAREVEINYNFCSTWNNAVVFDIDSSSGKKMYQEIEYIFADGGAYILGWKDCDGYALQVLQAGLTGDDLNIVKSCNSLTPNGTYEKINDAFDSRSDIYSLKLTN